jgi:hypothetical protein
MGAIDDILYRLRAEERERAEAIRLWRANACGGSSRVDHDMHSLVKDAADEIARLRQQINDRDRPGTPPAQSAE